MDMCSWDRTNQYCMQLSTTSQITMWHMGVPSLHQQEKQINYLKIIKWIGAHWWCVFIWQLMGAASAHCGCDGIGFRSHNLFPKVDLRLGDKLGYTSCIYILFGKTNTPPSMVMREKPTDPWDSKIYELQNVLLMNNFCAIESVTLIYPGLGQQSKTSHGDIKNIVQGIER